MWVSGILLLVLIFERVNVESYYEDLIFVGNELTEKMNQDIFIVNTLIAIVLSILFVCMYQLNRLHKNKQITS